MSDLTVIYYSDNKLDWEIEKKCVEQLKKSAHNHRIVSVTQKPMDIGDNICIGDIGSSWLNLYKQLQIGVEAATTKYIATAENDCLYTEEHFDFRPPKDDVFYYNENIWFVQWKGNHPELDGMYSTYWEERRALSQLICTREELLKSLNARLELLNEHGDEVKKIYQGEPGVSKIRLAQEAAKSGKGVSLAPFIAEYLEKEVSEIWKNKQPNLDIRHNGNFTGPKRGKNRNYDMKPWGNFIEYMSNDRLV